METKTIFMLFAAFLVVSVVVRKYVAGKAAKNRSSDLSSFSDRLDRLKKLDKFQPEGYEGETKKEIEKIRGEIYALLETVIKEGQEGDEWAQEWRIQELEKKFNEFSEKLRACIADWEKAEKILAKDLDLANEFLSKYTFFPTEFTYDMNKVQRKLESLREQRRSNPLSSREEYEGVSEPFRDKIKKYTILHEKTDSVIKKIEPLKSKVGAREWQKIVALQQELYFLLQNDNLSQAEKKLQELSVYVEKKQKNLSM